MDHGLCDAGEDGERQALHTQETTALEQRWMLRSNDRWNLARKTRKGFADVNDAYFGAPSVAKPQRLKALEICLLV